MSKKSVLTITALLLAVTIGTAAYYLRQRQYEIVHPKKGDLTEAVYGLGKVKSSKRFEAIVGVMSTVSRRFVNEGDAVKKGAPLIEFESHAVFRAPFPGTVTLAKLYEGETALPGIAVVRVEDLNNRYIEISLEQAAILRIKPGLKAKISFESQRGKIHDGVVTAIFPREDEFLVNVSIEDLDVNVLPGMSADVSIEVGTISNATLIPVKAIQNGVVTVRKDGRWKKIKVEVGHVDGISAEVKGDALSPDDEIRIKSGG
jgi:multidrug efflux pump subunit AcrA (membrane-fusion protein)